MKTLVIYDSNSGNTKVIAETIQKVIGKDAKAFSVVNFNKNELKGVDLLIVGSPIIGWKPSERMINFLNGLVKEELKGIKAATFDTRIKLFIHGDAADKIAMSLKSAGARIISEPGLFYVKGKEGPLFNGEIEKAVRWAKSVEHKLLR